MVLHAIDDLIIPADQGRLLVATAFRTQPNSLGALAELYDFSSKWLWAGFVMRFPFLTMSFFLLLVAQPPMVNCKYAPNEDHKFQDRIPRQNSSISTPITTNWMALKCIQTFLSSCYSLHQVEQHTSKSTGKWRPIASMVHFYLGNCVAACLGNSDCRMGLVLGYGSSHCRMYWSSDITFTQLVTNLALLKQLNHLQLNHTYGRHPKNAFALAEPVDGDEEQRQQISLPQIKNLVLISMNRSHDHFESLSPLVFPSVVEITLNDMTIGCIICKPNNNRHDLKVPKRCHELLILSLKEKFCANNSAVRLYARHGDYDTPFVDWTNYVPNEDDNL